MAFAESTQQAAQRALRVLRRVRQWLGHGLTCLALLGMAQAAQAATCFAIDDDTNTIVTYDSEPPLNVRFTTPIVTFGATPIDQVEAAYFDSVTNRYYVVRQSTPNVFGYVLPASGVFVPVGTSLGTTAVPTVRAVGTGNTGNNRIVGLARNPLDNKWYVIDRNGFLHEINPITGQFVPGSFSGNDYIRVRTPAGALLTDVEDMAFDNSGRLFVVQNAATANQFLRDINLITGLASSALNLGLTETEGLANALGDIRVIIGGNGSAATVRNFYSLNTTTGALTLLYKVPSPTATNADFEATGCNDGVPRADLKLAKTVVPTVVAPGGTATFTLRVEHEGIDIAHRIQVTDILPPGMTVLSTVQGTGCALCSFDIPTSVWSIDKMDIGQVRTMTLVVSTSGVTPNSFVENRAHITSVCQAATGPCIALIDVDSTPDNKIGVSWTPTEDDEAIAGLLVTANPAVAKSFNPSSGLAGQTTTVLFTFVNPNAISAATLTSPFVDTYPVGMVNAAAPAVATSCGGVGAAVAVAGANNVSLGAGRIIPAAGSCTLSVVVVVNSVGNYTNTVPTSALTVSVAGFTLTNVVGATAVYQVSPDNVGVIKDFNPDAIGVGQTTTLKITLSNPRNVAATLLSAFVDAYPSNLFNATPANPLTNCASGIATAANGGSSVMLGAGATIAPNASCTITVIVTSSTSGLYTNTIPAGSVSTSIGSNQGLSSSSLLVDNPRVEKAFIPAVATPGFASVQLRLTFVNPRPTAATITPAFVDVYPITGGVSMVNAATPAAASTCAGWTLVAAASTGQITVNPGAVIPALSSCVVTVNVRTNPTTGTGTFVNTVPAGSLTTSLGASTVGTTATLVVANVVNLGVTKVVTPTSALPGTTLTYTVTVTNAGPNTAFDALLTDFTQGVSLIQPITRTFSAGASISSITSSTSQITATMTIPNGGNIVYTFRGLPSIFNGIITNTASVSPGITSTDSNLANNTATALTTMLPAVNLTVAKSDGVLTVAAGQTTTYTVTFTNAGPSDASGSIVRDIPSAGLACVVQSCTGTGAASCGSPTASSLVAGYSIPSFPSGTSIALVLACGVTATGL
jgi:uncharacterized repeat protein (TIGR01451 family)